MDEMVVRAETRAQQIRREADRAGDLAQVLRFIQHGWSAGQFAEYRSGADLYGEQRRAELEYAQPVAREIWAAVERRDLERAGELAYSLREHMRALRAGREG